MKLERDISEIAAFTCILIYIATTGYIVLRALGDYKIRQEMKAYAGTLPTYPTPIPHERAYKSRVRHK
jgi:hypothetical protein